MKIRRLVVILAMLAAIGAGMWSLGLISPTWVAFQSSDGEWADSEVLMKGRDFDTVVVLFEMYKISCGVPNAQLQRITQKPSPLRIEHWLNDYAEPKWSVPYAAALPKTASGYYPPVGENHCGNRSLTDTEIELAEQRARRFVEELAQQAHAGDVRNARA